VTAAEAPRLDRSIDATGRQSPAPDRGEDSSEDDPVAEAGTIANSRAATRVTSSTDTAEALPIARRSLWDR
jgi:hypothetical protein